jgi:dihydroorotase-like cyclic amidohydrolase
MPKILIRNGTVVLPDCQLEKTDILVDGARIAVVGKNARRSRDASVIDAAGLFVSPGYWARGSNGRS